jgi:hypothetical protein
VENRHPSTFTEKNQVNFDDMFIDLRTDNDATNGNHLQSTSSDVDFAQQLGQAEHGSIPLQSSILRNPWFLKEVAARLQQNEDEVSSDDVSITKVPYANSKMAEISRINCEGAICRFQNGRNI